MHRTLSHKTHETLLHNICPTRLYGMRRARFYRMRRTCYLTGPTVWWGVVGRGVVRCGVVWSLLCCMRLGEWDVAFRTSKGYRIRMILFPILYVQRGTNKGYRIRMILFPILYGQRGSSKGYRIRMILFLILDG